jgi:hypothetical protein
VETLDAGRTLDDPPLKIDRALPAMAAGVLLTVAIVCFVSRDAARLQQELART